MNHCIVIIDDNKKQLDGYTKDIMNPFDIAEKMKAFGFHVETAKGNSVEAIDKAIEKVKQVQDQAVCIVLDSIKGAGVPYFENMMANHSVKFNTDEINAATNQAIQELEAYIQKEETSHV